MTRWVKPMATRSKLAVILHADIVGSTTLVQMDERVAHERIRDAFQHCSRIIARFGGSTHELRGDALLAEFQRPSDAVTAALAIQAENGARNVDLTDEIRPVIRIGIALGEVVIADDTVTGPGVVLAQRLEQLAEPGGVCLQSSVHESVPKRFPFDYEDLGDQSLKGFGEPVRAFSVTLQAGELLPAPELKPPPESQIERPRRRWPAIVTVALLFVIGGLVGWWQPWNPSFTPASVERMKFPLPEKPSIAVLPFDNLSGDPKQEFFADGITEDVITALSKIPNMFVIARNTTFTYKGKPVKVQQVAEDLGVRYVLEGSVQKIGERVRITAQLVDALSGRHLWVDRYDRDFKEIFALQDELARYVVTALQVNLTAGEQARVWRRQTESAEAYELFLRGKATRREGGLTRANNAEQRALYEKAVALDPNFASAWLALAEKHQTDVRFGWSNNRAQSLSLSAEAMSKALAIDDTLPSAHYQLANAAIIKRQYDQAIGHCEKALTLAPGANVMMHCARIWTYVGRPKEALELITEAMRRNPYFRPAYYFTLGNAHLLMGNYEDAIAAFKAWGAADKISLPTLIMLTHAYVESGRMEEARATVKKILRRSPKFSMKVPTRVLRYKDPARKERMLANLRAAGVPE